MKITTQLMSEPSIDDSTFEGCSEAPKGCDRCCDKSSEAALRGDRPESAVAQLSDLLLLD